MLFGKKVPKELPVEQVHQLMQKGMNEKDIVKTLKSQGYSYSDIEKSMMEAVKAGVEEKPLHIEERQKEDDMFAPRSLEEEMPEFAVMPEQAVESDVLIEELIEGIVEEKWKKFEDKVNTLENDMNKAEVEFKMFQQKIDMAQNSQPTKELEIKMNELSEQLEDLQIRVGGLEKAFKQFLPSLTRNIESLSDMITKMKEKHELREMQ